MPNNELPRDATEIPTTLSTDEAAFAAHFPVNPEQIGARLGAGMGHTVYAYEDDAVVKIPKWRGLKHESNPTVTAERRQETVDTIQAHFPGYALETEVMSSATNPSYIMAQRRLAGFRNLTPADLAQNSIRRQLDDIMAKNAALFAQKGMSLDFMGREGMTNTAKSRFSKTRQPEVSNIVIEENADGKPRLVIADMSLLRLGRDNHDVASLSGRRSSVINAVTLAINRWLIQKHFGYDITGGERR